MKTISIHGTKLTGLISANDLYDLPLLYGSDRPIIKAGETITERIDSLIRASTIEEVEIY